ncbi:MAG: AAA family ATPase [Bradyrhizobium sp.]|uniref:AAA family ATPase n=1 Tax=Bradyrhizobium sp. TaxID=376 RepID=UPI001DF14048|nr:AAA family ATPase [Bradyrhizobium sp.]MBV9559283.1 AAA family ATPase [Bradyrhizobium sp.]
MRCRQCGEEYAASNRFCHGCGVPLPATCAACGNVNPPASAFCGACGSPLAPMIRPLVPSQPTRAVRGELKQVTVLFADLVSSTEIVARLDPEDAMEHLKPLLDAMCEAVERFEGTVVRTLGDGILALFGAPRAHERHALLACEAALAIRDSSSLREAAMSVRVGMHSGEIVVDAPLAEPTGDRGAYGMTIHLASRLPAEVEPGGICLTDETYRLVRAFCDVDPLGRRRLRGVPEAIELFLFKGLKPAVASQQFRGVVLTSFRGRDRELTLLQRALAAVETDGSRVIAIVGAPGTGKSRLCYEFAEWCRGRLIPVFEARAQPFGATTPLQPVLEFLRSTYFNVSPDDDPNGAARQIAIRLAELGSTFEADVPLVCDFLGIKYDQSQPAWINPKGRNARLLDIVRHLIRQRGTVASVIIIEDLHWLDQASEEFVATLADEVTSTKTVLIVNCRPAYSAPWMRPPHYQQIELAELNPSDADHLINELVGLRPELSEIRRQVVSRSGGNPFFAEELVRSLVEHVVLVGERGDYRRGMIGGADVLPPTVQAVIGARIDRLAQPERDLLQIAAIIGKDFQLAVLQEVAGWKPVEIESSLDRLRAAGLLQPRYFAESRGYSFRHPLIQEVAYSTQLRARRGALHAAVGRAIERFYPGRHSEFAALLSHHFEEAGEIDTAADYAARAARWVGSTSPAQAIKHWHKVRTLKAHQPRTPANDALRIEASGQIAWLGWREGMTSEEAQPFIQEALEWARAIDDSMVPLLFFVEGRIAAASGGAADAYVERVEQALSLIDLDRDRGRVATLNASLSQAYGWAGLLREALSANDAALEGVSSVTDFDHQFLGYSVEHWTLSLRGRILLRLGRFDAARACFDRMLAIPGLIAPTVQIIANFAYVELAWCLGDVSMARDYLTQVVAIAARHGSAYLRLYALACEGIAHGIVHDYGSGIRATSEALRLLREAHVSMEFEPELLASLADFLARSGEVDKAIETANEAIAVARNRTARLPECRAQITLGGALLAARGSQAADEAKMLLDGAETLIERTGACIYEGLLKEARSLLSRYVMPHDGQRV